MDGADSLSFGLAFAAGLASFLSPCVLPLVPGYLGFVTGLTPDELRAGGAAGRRRAVLHAALFVLGFALVFVALGATATSLGGAARRALPLLQQAGGVLVVALGLAQLGVLRVPALLREHRLHLASRPAGLLGSVLVGVVFGAGWTPCIGPVLASILLYAGLEATMARGLPLLAAYALGLGLPFLGAALGVDRFLAGSRRLRHWGRPLEVGAGALLVALGVLLFTGRFAALTAFLAGFGQLISLEQS